AAQCSNPWLAGQGLPGVDAEIFAMANWDPDGAGPAPAKVVCAGAFRLAGNVPVNYIAAWDPVTDTWSPLGLGTNGIVWHLLVMPNGDLVASGNFTVAGGVAANGIARWNGVSWSPLGAGIAPVIGLTGVHSMLVLPNGDLVVGGDFTSVGGISAN